MYPVEDTVQERLLARVVLLQPELAPRLVLRLGHLPDEQLETLLASHEELVCAIERALLLEMSEQDLAADRQHLVVKSTRACNKIIGPPPGLGPTSNRELGDARFGYGFAPTRDSGRDTPVSSDHGPDREITKEDAMHESSREALRSCDDGPVPSREAAHETHCESGWTDKSVACLEDRIADLQPEMAQRITQSISDLGPEAVQECLESDVKLQQRVHESLQAFFAEEPTVSASVSPAVDERSSKEWLGHENFGVVRSRRCDVVRPHAALQNVVTVRRNEGSSRPITSVGRPNGLGKVQASCFADIIPRDAVSTSSKGYVSFGHRNVPSVVSPINGAALALASSPPGGRSKSIWGLESFLSELGLSDYHDAVSAWSSAMGAAYLEELVENAADLSDALGLKPLERKRLERQGAEAARSAVRGRPSPSSALILAAAPPEAPEPSYVPSPIFVPTPPVASYGKTRRV